MSESNDLQPWHMECNSAWRAGFAFGARYPSLVFNLRGEPLGAEDARALANDLIAALRLPGLEDDWAARNRLDPNSSGFAEIVHLLLLALNRLQRSAGLPVFETGRILRLESQNAQILVTTTSGTYQLIANIMHCLLHSVRLIKSGDLADHNYSDITNLCRQLRNIFGYHLVANKFISTALNLGIPFVQLPDRVIEYGQGHLARRMLDTLTDATSNISVHLARNKNYAAAVLREAGIPVPLHFLVENEQQALQVANDLGFPVVVKPADRDGGEAVGAGLLTPEEVRHAFAKAFAASRKVLVEKHVPGRDYRITVYLGQAIWAVERVPGGIVGDGKASVRELVDRLNGEPRRKIGAEGGLKPIIIDSEANAWLRRVGMTEGSIPALAEFIRLRGAANVASGGLPVAVYDQLHPDNAQLAVRAANALGADIAGIDLLIPDISCSWLESGAFVCEVNPGPDIGQLTAAHLFEPILASLLEGNGRIPIVLVVGAEAGSPTDRLFEEGLDLTDMTIGYYDQHGIRVRGEWLARNPVGSYLAGQILARDRRVEAIIMRIDDNGLLATGLPFQRIDMLVIAGNAVNVAHSASPLGCAEAMMDLVTSLLTACDGPVVILPEAEFELDISEVQVANELRTDISAEMVEPYLCERIRGLAALHRAPKPALSSIPAMRD